MSADTRSLGGVMEVQGGRLADLYARHAPAAVRLAYLMTGERALAEDLVQEAFARVIGRLGHLREPDAFDHYLRRSVVNLAKNVFRRRSVERAWLAKEASLRPRQGAESDVAETDAMLRALRRVPARQRAALVLRYYEDLPEEACAAILQCRPGTVRSLVSRGLESLRAQLRGEIDE